MTTWYGFEPTDSLFFKGATPMQAGVDHTADSIFPPRPSTIEGALRTLVLKQQGVAMKDYYQDRASPEIIETIGPAGMPAPFTVIGPLFQVHGRILIPAPYTWYRDKDKDGGKTTHIRIIRSQPLEDIGTGGLEIMTSAGAHTYWVSSGSSEIESLGGLWITPDLLHGRHDEPVALYRSQTAPPYPAPLAAREKDLYVEEPHVGLALNENRRTAKRHHLYSFTHYRLLTGVKLVFGVDRELPLQKRGIMQLGGEKRFGFYERIEGVDLVPGTSGLFLALGVVKAEAAATQALVATGKPFYVGGWDMRKGFHKAMSGYYPPGTVFNAEIKSNLIEI